MSTHVPFQVSLAEPRVGEHGQRLIAPSCTPLHRFSALLLEQKLSEFSGSPRVAGRTFTVMTGARQEEPLCLLKTSFALIS